MEKLIKVQFGFRMCELSMYKTHMDICMYLYFSLRKRSAQSFWLPSVDEHWHPHLCYVYTFSAEVVTSLCGSFVQTALVLEEVEQWSESKGCSGFTCSWFLSLEPVSPSHSLFIHLCCKWVVFALNLTILCLWNCELVLQQSLTYLDLCSRWCAPLR